MATLNKHALKNEFFFRQRTRTNFSGRGPMLAVLDQHSGRGPSSAAADHLFEI